MLEINNKEVCSLVEKVRKDKQRNFSKLYQEIWNISYYIALNMLNNHYDAEDAAQESLIKVYMQIDTLQDNKAFNRWLNQIVLNTCRTAIKKSEKVQKGMVDEDVFSCDEAELEEETNRKALPEVLFEDKEVRDTLLCMIRQLSKKQMEVILLYYYQSFSIKECSETLLISETAVKNLLYSARIGLRKHIEAEQAKGKLVILRGVAIGPLLIYLFGQDASEVCTAAVNEALWSGISSSVPVAAGGTAASVPGAVIAKIAVITTLSTAVAVGGASVVLNHLDNDTSPARQAYTSTNSEDKESSLSPDMESIGPLAPSDNPSGNHTERSGNPEKSPSSEEPHLDRQKPDAESELSTTQEGTESPSDSQEESAILKVIDEPGIREVRITNAPELVTAGDSISLTAQVTGTNSPSQKVKWQVSGVSSGTTISQSGVLTVASNEGGQNITITASASSNPVYFDRITIAVKPRLPDSMQGLTGDATDVGRIFEADGYGWKVIKADGSGHLLIVTEGIIATGQFSAGTYGSYSGSNLDSLMQTFYTARLNVLKSFVKPVFIETETDRNAAAVTGGLSYVSDSGIKTAFALSVSEVNTCFGAASEKTAAGGSGWYWLRSPGNTSQMAAGIAADGTLISYDTQLSSGGIRPALWIAVG